MRIVISTTPSARVPAWAVLQRRLFDECRAAAEIYLRKYMHDDGSLVWRDSWNNGRDGVDDFYEAYINWPLLYLLGGDDWFLEKAQRGWDAITRQLTAFGVVRDEYELGYDQFHQSEHYTMFYALCMADRHNQNNIDRARRFANLYLGQPNYDRDLKMIRAPHNGSGGPRWGFFDAGVEPVWGWSQWMQPYGLPFDDVPGVHSLEDLKQPVLAACMGAALHERYGSGDVAANLSVCSVVANAYLLTGDASYRDWLVDYVGAWLERAEANDGLIPDNVGPSGKVGELVNGKWYGGLYGWQWPHGYYNIGMAVVVAATSAFLATRNTRFLQLPRHVLDTVFAQGTYTTVAEVKRTSLGHHWINQLHQLRDDDTMFVVPYRHGDSGWFDYQPMSPTVPAALWALTQSDEDLARIERIRAAETYDWRQIASFHTKEDGGHEQPWLRFLAGDNAAYPEEVLQAALVQVARRIALIERDTADLTQVNIHHWQQLNPVTTEALVQQTLGTPQPIYNGGLLVAPVGYFDGVCGRPGLPRDVAALVTHVSARRLTVHLVNVSTTTTREVIVQAGAFGEHRFDHVAYDQCTTESLGLQTDYAAPPLITERASVNIVDSQLRVVLPPLHETTLDLTMTRYVNLPHEH